MINAADFKDKTTFYFWLLVFTVCCLFLLFFYYVFVYEIFTHAMIFKSSYSNGLRH